MEVQDHHQQQQVGGGGWNPVEALVLHCHNVHKCFKPIASISANSNDHPLNSFVSAVASVKKGMGMHPLFRQSNSNDRDSSQLACSCSSSNNNNSNNSSYSINSSSSGSSVIKRPPVKGFFGLSFPNLRDSDEKAVQSCSCSCQDSERKVSQFQGFSIPGLNVVKKEAPTVRCFCCCAKGESGGDVKEPRLEGMINVSVLLMSMIQGQRKPVAPVYCSSSDMSKGASVEEELHPLMRIPVLGFLSHRFSKPKCDRKRTRLACTCGHERHDRSSRQAVKRFSLANFVQLRDDLVQNGTKRLRIGTLGFARLQGQPDEAAASIVVPDEEAMETAPLIKKAKRNPGSQMERLKSFAAHSAMQPIQVKLPNMDDLRSSLATLGVKEGFQELVDRVTTTITKSSSKYPDKKKLTSVQDFFRYTEAEGKRLFNELDRDRDGQVTLDDLEVAMKKRRLPQRYAKEFLKRTRKNWFAKSIGWSEFHTLMEQKEPKMLRAYTTMSLSKSGTLQKNQVLASLRNAGLPATDGNAAAMMKFLNVDAEGSIAYGQFRNFMLLLPPERLGDDPRMVWFEAATVVPMAPPVDIPAGSVLKSAFAGGLASGLSTSMLHPLDTVKKLACAVRPAGGTLVKRSPARNSFPRVSAVLGSCLLRANNTRVQASTLSFPEVIAKLPQIGIRGMYRGSIPAILGQFTSHGIRTGVLEASKLLLKNMAPNVSDLQVQSLSSFTSTVIGTAVRIPCEVLKQRLQAGLYNSVGEAIVGTYQRDGLKGFFRGTGVTLCREVPFYVAGMSIYEEAKKVVQKVLNRELQPWETIAVGGLSGGLAAIATTPFDVMKTRTMTAAPGMPSTMGTIMVAIVKDEGLLALFKGAIPRFFWIAPLGAMNFAGYELAKRAMENKEKEVQALEEQEKSR